MTVLSDADRFCAGLSAERSRPTAEASSVPLEAWDFAQWQRPAQAAPGEDGSVGAAPGEAGPGGAAPGEAGPGEALSAPATALVAAVAAVAGQPPAELTGAQALFEASVLLGQLELLRAAVLGRIADIDRRHLHMLDGAPSTATWVARQKTSIDRGEIALAKRLGRFPVLSEALLGRRVSVGEAKKVAAALSTLRRHVDRPDNLIDGQDGEQVVAAVVIDGVRQLVCEALGGLPDDDALLGALTTTLTAIASEPTTQLARLEAAFVLLAEHLETPVLGSALSRLLDALLPNELERRAADGHDARGFGMSRKPDGSGWIVTTGELDLECGELLHTFLTAELAVDPDNPADTAGFEQLRAQGWLPGDPLPEGGAPGDPLPLDALLDGGASGDALHGNPLTGDAAAACAGPRSLRQRRHDALRNGLRRYLDSGLAGLRDKVAPHLAITVGLEALHGAPGALPAVGASGTSLPASLVRRWVCDSAITRFVLSLGNKVLETSHTARTLTGPERRAKQLETGGRCQGAGCARGPGNRLIPHHVTPWATCGTTSLSDTVLLCEQTHRDVHLGGHPIRLKDGRLLGPHGWTARPDVRPDA